jgi:hypothetical protein
MKILIQSNFVSFLEMKTLIVSYYEKLSHIEDHKLSLSKIKLRSNFLEIKDSQGLNPKEKLINVISLIERSPILDSFDYNLLLRTDTIVGLIGLDR